MGTRIVTRATIFGTGLAFSVTIYKCGHTNGDNTEMYTWNQLLAVDLGRFRERLPRGTKIYHQSRCFGCHGNRGISPIIVFRLKKT